MSESGHSAMQLGRSVRQSVKSSQLTRCNQLVSQSVKVSVNRLSIKYFGWSIIVRMSNQCRLTGRWLRQSVCQSVTSHRFFIEVENKSVRLFLAIVSGEQLNSDASSQAVLVVC